MENPGSFLRKNTFAKETLLACKAPYGECSEVASDYEFFRAFCRAADKLSHNRLLLAAYALLAKNGCREVISEQTVDAIWRYFASLGSVAEPDDGAFLGEETDEDPPLTLKDSDFISLDELLKKAGDPTTPKAFADALMCAFFASGKTGLSVDLPDDAYQRQPSLYAVEQALAKKGDPVLLSLQAIRIFAEKKIPMLLTLSGRADTTLAFLSRLDSLVGLPELFLMLTKESLDSVLAFLLSPKAALFHPVLTKGLSKKIASPLYYRYPMGNTYLLV